MKTIEKFKELIEGGCLDCNDKDVLILKELNMGTYLLQDEKDDMFFITDFELEPEDFKQDIAFLMNFAESNKEREEFIGFMYDKYKTYWKTLAMTKEDLTRSVTVRFNERDL